MAIFDDIFAILKQANPTANDAELKAQATQFSAHPDAPSVMSSFAPSSFDVATSDNTVTQNGRPESLPAMSPPTSPSSQQPVELPPAPVEPLVEPVPTPKPEAVASVAPAAPESPKSPAPVMPTMPVGPSDNDRRQELLDAANKKARMSAIPAAIAGVGGAIGNAAQAFGVHPDTGAEKDILDRAHAREEGEKVDIEKGISNDPNSEASRSARALILQIAPQMAQQPGFNEMSDQEIRNKLPLVDTMMKARASEDAKKLALEQLKATKSLALSEKDSQFQDRAINSAMSRIAGVRGDPSLARTENQRDASSSAYTLLQQARNEGRPLTQPEYYDLLGQLWQARTGRAPTAEAMRDLDAKTFQGHLNKVATYFSGKPAGATTQAALDNLQQFVKHTGEFADKQHEAYMVAHLMKPAGVSEEAWAPIKATARGRSFADTVAGVTPPSNAPAGPARKTSSGFSYTVQR